MKKNKKALAVHSDVLKYVAEQSTTLEEVVVALRVAADRFEALIKAGAKMTDDAVDNGYVHYEIPGHFAFDAEDDFRCQKCD